MDAAHTPIAPRLCTANPRIEPARFGVWLFLVTEAMFFAGLVSAWIVLRNGSSAQAWGGSGTVLSVRSGGVATAMLLLSSLCVSRAVVASRRGRDARIVASWARRTVLFGALFLALQACEWRECILHGVTPRANLYWSSYYVLTGAHALHVAAGLAWLASAWQCARRGTHPLRLELCALYWHLVDLVWLVLFTLLYLF